MITSNLKTEYAAKQFKDMSNETLEFTQNLTYQCEKSSFSSEFATNSLKVVDLFFVLDAFTKAFALRTMRAAENELTASNLQSVCPKSVLYSIFC